MTNQYELRDEAKELVERLVDHVAALPPRDGKFVQDMADRFEVYGDATRVTRPQVFWLRDIAERVT